MEDPCTGIMFQPGQLVRANLAGLQAEGVMFQAAVTDAVGHTVKQTSEQPPKYLVKLLFSFRGVTEVEVPADRIHADRLPIRGLRDANRTSEASPSSPTGNEGCPLSLERSRESGAAVHCNGLAPVDFEKHRALMRMLRASTFFTSRLYR